MKILFLAPSRSSWIEKDFHLIQKHHQATFQLISNIKSSLAVTKQVIDHDLLFCWFGSFRYVLPVLVAKVLKKPVLIVTAGYDVAAVNEINYGALSQNVPYVTRLLRKAFLSIATRVLPVSNSNLKQCLGEANLPIEKCEVIPLFVETPSELSLIPFDQKKNQIIIIANIPNHTTYLCKGMDIFIQLAVLLPQYNFKIMGSFAADVIPKNLPENVVFLGAMPYMSKEFIREIQEAKFAIQPSRHESFCSAIVEAAALGTFPLGSNLYALSEVVPKIGGRVSLTNSPISYSELISEIEKTGYDPKAISKKAQESYKRTTRETKIKHLLNQYEKLK